MKKTLFGGIFMLSLVAFLATGCNTEKVETSGDDMITFNTAVGKQTRATEFTTTMLQDECSNPDTPLTVKAYYQNGGGYYRTFGLFYANSQWSYGIPVRYPTDGLIYYATYPNLEINENLTFEYTVVEDPEQQIDLLATKTVADGADATLVFNHILSQINFAIQGAAGYEVTIVGDITIRNIVGDGIYTFDNTTDHGVVGSWTPGITNASYVYVPEGISPVGDEIVYLGNYTPQDFTSCTNALMLIPQKFDAVGQEANCLEFTYSITENGNPNNTGTETAHISLNNTEWLPGMRYIIILDFSGEYIKFINVEVGSWNDEERQVIPNPADPEI